MSKIHLPNPTNLFAYLSIGLAAVMILAAAIISMRALLVTIKNPRLDTTAITPQEQTLDKVLEIIGEKGIGN